jgi:Ca2+-binding EF-hand superfamily protein
MKYRYLTIAVGLVGATLLAPAVGHAATASLAFAATGSEADANRAAQPRRMAAMQERFPIDLSLLEARATALFDHVDAAGDGVITRAEFVAAEIPRDAMGPGLMGERAGPQAGPGRPGIQRQQRSGPRRGDAERQARSQEMLEARRAQWQAEVFAAADTDGDGQLSQEEFARLPEVHRELARTRMFERLDVNGDGVLDRDEFPRWWAELRAMDRDGDGLVTFAEMREHRSAMRERHGFGTFRRPR